MATRFTLPTGERISLTPRQLTVLQRIAAGDSNKEAAAAMSITLKTAKNHLYDVFQILGVHTRTQAVTFSLWASIVFPPLSNSAIASPTPDERLRRATRKRLA